ncbi:MAG: hypothetical protein AABO41_15245 [Acidobacteriota bacterium]
MLDVSKLIPRIEALIKRADPKVITERTFYDAASNRLYIGLVKGSRKTEFTLQGNRLTSDHQDETVRLIEEALGRLSRVPVG